MKIPAVTKIAGVGYHTKYEENLDMDGFVLLGEINHRTSTISLNSSQDMDYQSQISTYLHEVLHGIFYHYNVPVKPHKEEEIVEALSHGLHQFLLDNSIDLFKDEFIETWPKEEEN